MRSVLYWKTLLQQHKLPCLIADFNQEEVLYCNEELEKLMGGKEKVIGQKFQEIIKNDLEDKPILLSGKVGEILSKTIYDQHLNQEYVATVAVGEYGGEKYIFVKYLSSSYSENPNFDFEFAMSRCISILQQNEENKNESLLQVVGEFFDAEKAYLFQINRKESKISALSFWRQNESVPLTKELGDKFDVSVMIDWLDSRTQLGMIDVGRNYPNFDPESFEGKILGTYHVNNLLVSLLEDENHVPVGLLMVCNRENMAPDFRLLHGVGQFMENQLTKSENTVALEQLNQMDLLTGFYSRSVYAQLVEEYQSNPPSNLGVISANVNGLRKVNSQYGYAKGDAYLKEAAELLQAHFGTEFYRVSGDEFISFILYVDKDLLEEKVHSLQEKMRNNGNYLFSLGHSHGTGRADVHKLVRDADTMVYINKQEYYHNNDVSFTDMKDSLLSDLLSYLVNKEFMIYLQPQVKLADGSIYGAEALIRRFDKVNQKMVFPDQFISTYEQRSIIRHVDIFVVEEVCRLLEALRAKGKEIPISVNLSRVTLQEFGIVDTIAKICDRFNVAHELLILEVTERVGLIENDVPSALVEDFKRHGFKISLDDFGCAYSNIITLAQIEVDEVKLDKSLVDNLTTNEKNFILVRNILRMCSELKETSVLAEGIEDETQGKFLHQLGCLFGQGYYYSKPLSVPDFCEKYFELSSIW
ncbi:MAG: bifunctional diguanylate cyclase/phosphodiesterase [Eubacteriales bacterium]